MVVVMLSAAALWQERDNDPTTVSQTAQFGVGQQVALVELLGIEADRAHIVAAARVREALEQVGERWATLAGNAGRHTVDREAYGLLGEEHEAWPPLLGGADRDQEGDGDGVQGLRGRSSG